MGLGIFWKPTGIGSQDYLKEIKKNVAPGLARKKGKSQIGHSGTLDPFAEGLLCVGWGEGTKLLASLVGLSKTYEAEIVFGATTDTLDPTGQFLFPDSEQAESGRKKVEQFLDSKTTRQSFLENHLGKQNQVPPKFSAIRIEGKRAYNLARNEPLSEQDLDAQMLKKVRTVEVFSARDVGAGIFINAEGKTYQTWIVEVRVSAGTYIRSLARDWAQEISGYSGFLSKLKRTGVGPWTLAHGSAQKIFSLEDLRNHFEIFEMNSENSFKLKSFGSFDLQTRFLKLETPKLLIDRITQAPVAWLEATHPPKIGRIFLENPLATGPN